MGCGTCPKGIVGAIVHGVVGVVKAIAGIDRPDEDLIQERVRGCLGDPSRGIARCPAAGNGWFCADCGPIGCIIQLKIRVKSEKRPSDRCQWPR